jgi:hypothetical protein
MTAAAATLPEHDPLAAQADEAGVLLRELAQIGMGMARGLGRFAEALADSVPVDVAPTADQAKTADSLMRAFGRVSRAVRQSLALQAKLIADVVKAKDRVAADKTARAEAEAAALAPRRARGRLRRAMAGEMAMSAIEALEAEPLETERLFDDLDEKFAAMRPETYGASRAKTGAETGEDATPDDADFADIEVDAMALQLCAELGIDPGPDWWFTHWGMEHPPRKRSKPTPPAQPPP